MSLNRSDLGGPSNQTTIKTTTNNLKNEDPAQETRDWTSLPNNVIHLIAKSFNSLADFYYFRNTCPSWRAVAKPSSETFASQSPIVLLPLKTFRGKRIKALMDLFTGEFYKVPPFLSWGNRRLLNCKDGYIAMSQNNGCILLKNFITREEIPLPISVRQLKESSNLIFSQKPTSAECIFILYETYGATYEFCKRGDQNWTIMQFDSLTIMDMAFHDGRLYALLTMRDFFGRTRQLAIIDLAPRLEVVFLSSPDPCNGMSFLASTGEELLMISGGAYYRWEMEGQRWIITNSFGGKAVFTSGCQYTASEDPATIFGIEPDFCYIYCVERDFLGGASVINNEERWTVRNDDYVDLIGEFAECGRPVWVFPSQCFD